MLRAATHVACKCWFIARPIAMPIHFHKRTCFVNNTDVHLTRSNVACNNTCAHVHVLRATTHVAHVHMLRATSHVACTCWFIDRPIARPINKHTGRFCVQHMQTCCTSTRAHVASMHLLCATTYLVSISSLEHVHMLRTTTHVACRCYLYKCANPNTCFMCMLF
jgi:hypothetical protein